MGGSAYDEGLSVTTSSDSNLVFLCGEVGSKSGIATIGAHQTTFGSTGTKGDGFIAQFDSSGTLNWGTYLGGTDFDECSSVACDSFNNVFVCGLTTSTNAIATPGAYQDTFKNSLDNFIVKFNSKGRRIWGTYFGGTGHEGMIKAIIAIDNSNNIYLAGETESTANIATYGAPQTKLNGKSDGYVTKFDNNGRKIWGTYFGGDGLDQPFVLAVDNSGNLYINGRTLSKTSFSTSGAHDSTLNGPTDGFLVKFIQKEPDAGVISLDTLI